MLIDARLCRENRGNEPGLNALERDGVTKGDILRAESKQILRWQRVTQSQIVPAIVILLIDDKTKLRLVRDLMNDV